jgi:anti-sigma factor RsiW
MHISDELLNEYLDNALQDRAPVDSHLSSCDECAARLTALRDLFAELESLPELALSRDLAAPITRRLGGSNAFPRWLPLTVTLQAAFALVALVIAAPFVMQFLSPYLATAQSPSFTDLLVQLQSEWTAWLDILSQIQMPTLPEIPFVEVSSLAITLTLAGVSMLWLVGNGLLLRNQMK